MVTETKVKFGDVSVGTKIRLEATTGVKIDPITSASSAEFYARYGHRFYGWNFEYPYYAGDGHWENGHYSLGPDTEVVVLT